jgi:hypothetical protein
MQVSIQVKGRVLNDLIADLGAARRDVKYIARTASYDTAKQAKTHTSKLVRETVNIKKKDLDPNIDAVRLGNGAKMSVKESKRLPLRDFGAKDTKKNGVTYRISKGGAGSVQMSKRMTVATTRGRGGRGRVSDAFILNKATRKGKPHDFSGHVFKRVGKKRNPIRKLYGVSAWGVVVKNDMIRPIAAQAEINLEKNVLRRINLQMLRRTGVVKH